MKASHQIQASLGALGALVLATSLTACSSANVPDRGVTQGHQTTPKWPRVGPCRVGPSGALGSSG
jgi:hypothetical protein